MPILKRHFHSRRIPIEEPEEGRQSFPEGAEILYVIPRGFLFVFTQPKDVMGGVPVPT